MIDTIFSNKHKTFPLKRFILRTQTVVAIVFVLAYTAIVNLYFIAGLDESNYQDLQLEAHHFAMQYQRDPNLPPPSTIHFNGYIGWQNVPDDDKQYFPELALSTEATNRNVVLTHKSQWLTPPKEVIYVVTLPLANNKILFLFRHINSDKYAISMDSKISTLVSSTLLIAMVFFLLFHLVVKLTLKYNLKRLNHLDRWVGELTLDNVEQPIPNFNFDEFNRIADKQRTTLLQIKNLIENEQDFLRHASHELRTPIAVVKSNSELLERLLSANTLYEQTQGNANQKALARIARAANNMQQLTETLLWLSREESEYITSEKVSLKELLTELIEDNNYLLKGKSVDVFTRLADDQLTLAVTPCRLVLNNIIRNAFQYTQNGAINIIYSNQRVRIDNVNYLSANFSHAQYGRTETLSNDYGFGLGLRLVEKIISKLAWDYQNIAILDGRSVEINFSGIK
jgi:signal transduction histidine kinase